MSTTPIDLAGFTKAIMMNRAVWLLRVRATKDLQIDDIKKQQALQELMLDGHNRDKTVDHVVDNIEVVKRLDENFRLVPGPVEDTERLLSVGDAAFRNRVLLGQLLHQVERHRFDNEKDSQDKGHSALHHREKEHQVGYVLFVQDFSLKKEETRRLRPIRLIPIIIRHDNQQILRETLEIRPKTLPGRTSASS
jgi:hypothetical protein